MLMGASPGRERQKAAKVRDLFFTKICALRKYGAKERLEGSVVEGEEAAPDLLGVLFPEDVGRSQRGLIVTRRLKRDESPPRSIPAEEVERGCPWLSVQNHSPGLHGHGGRWNLVGLGRLELLLQVRLEVVDPVLQPNLQRRERKNLLS